MANSGFPHEISQLSSANVADACVRLGFPMRIAPTGVRPVRSGCRVAGMALPVEQYGSVDIFFEAMEMANTGDVLVIGNQGRMDEGCVGDLTILEARHCGLAGVIVWGCHRDHEDILEIGLPVFSYGTCPLGPTRLEPRRATAMDRALFGSFEVSREDFVFADDDGVIFVDRERLEEIVSKAADIRRTERIQADSVRYGSSLRKQFRFGEYLEKRASDPSYTFRQHLRFIGGAIEE